MATIIKHDMQQHGSGVALRHVAYDLTDLAAGAEQYLGTVRGEAAKIVEQAHRDAAAVRQDAEAAGRRAAEQAIERILDEKVAQQMKTLTPALQAAVEQIRDARQQWLQQWESSAIELATAIAARLLRGELVRRPEISLQWVREALDLIGACGEFAIHLHPSDRQTLERQITNLAAATHPTATVRLADDATITPGGCRVVSQFGSVDMQIESQLQRIKEELA